MQHSTETCANLRLTGFNLGYSIFAIQGGAGIAEGSWVLDPSQLEPDQRCDRRDAYMDEVIAECARDLVKIGKAEAIQIRQKLKDFMKLWRDGLRAHDRTGFDYKQLRDRDSLELRIKQIRVAAKYRAALIIVETMDPRIVFLSVYIKNKQPDGIKTAVRRARKYKNEGATND